jgi:hypothetical protein
MVVINQKKRGDGFARAPEKYHNAMRMNDEAAESLEREREREKGIERESESDRIREGERERCR